jgi:acetyltransferase-like isoleucine patch superfamily enzyme
MQNPFDPGYWRTPELRQMGFASVGENVAIARNCAVIGLPNISIGDNVRIDAFCSILCASGKIEFGSNIHLCTAVMLGGRGGIALGDFSCISSGARLFSASDDFNGEWMASCNVPAEYTRPVVAPIVIGRHVPIGANSVILPGVTVGEGAAICAMTCVPRSLAPWTMYAGIPARKVGPRRRRVLELEGQFHGLRAAA